MFLVLQLAFESEQRHEHGDRHPVHRSQLLCPRSDKDRHGSNLPGSRFQFSAQEPPSRAQVRRHLALLKKGQTCRIHNDRRKSFEQPRHPRPQARPTLHPQAKLDRSPPRIHDDAARIRADECARQCQDTYATTVRRANALQWSPQSRYRASSDDQIGDLRVIP